MNRFLVTTRPILSCNGCIHEFDVRGEKRCDLGERWGIRCTMFRLKKGNGV
jgi:hypothetical protein